MVRPAKRYHGKGIRITIAASLFPFLFISTAQSDPASWLSPGSRINPERETPEFLIGSKPLSPTELLGKLLFNSPSLLGEKSIRMGLSCNSCHPAGNRNPQFFIPELSKEAGQVDLTNRFWFEGAEDGKFNPVTIPSLQNLRKLGPFGTIAPKNTITEFTEHVITAEFGGPKPTEFELNALVSYMKRIGDESTGRLSPSPPLNKYLELLIDPIKVKDSNAIQRISGLLREELGRRRGHATNNESYSKIAKQLKTIAQTPDEAPKLLNQLLQAAVDQ
ncbi:hypothetical protein [Sneathiella glossodoripedis]|uniref:hypothetical protein n=1 Tax=Sneathiella glossodoripedis TaxID=418853 RepID=UPI0011DD6208|nr:hypothetical protein [Sneathiella glossodoripedis]